MLRLESTITILKITVRKIVKLLLSIKLLGIVCPNKKQKYSLFYAY